MQSIAYSGGPYSVLWYLSELAAYRADRWEGFVQWPGGIGEIWEGGAYGSRLSVAELGTTTPTAEPAASGEAPAATAPAATAAPSASPAPGTDGGTQSSTGLLVAGGIGVIVVIGVIVYLVRRRRSDDD